MSTEEPCDRCKGIYKNGHASFTEDVPESMIEDLDMGMVRYVRRDIRKITPLYIFELDHHMSTHYPLVIDKCHRFKALISLYLEEFHRLPYKFFMKIICDYRKKWCLEEAPHPLDVFLPPLCVARVRFFMENCKCCR